MSSKKTEGGPVNTSSNSSMALSGVVVVLLVDYWTQHRAWGWMRLIQGAAALKDVPGLLFVKVMGSGHGGGFGLRPSGSHQGLICLFENEQKAADFCQAPHVLAIVDHAREHWLSSMAVTSARGQWDELAWGVTPNDCLIEPQDHPDSALTSGLVAVLTRGTIRPAKALAFWRYSPPAQKELDSAKGCCLAMGLGEAPLLRQCTFSLWSDTESMVAYAQTGAHKLAITAAYKNDYFAESMFVRMRVLSMSGVWHGKVYSVSREVQHG
jgi:spheroidene monooxygenase